MKGRLFGKLSQNDSLRGDLAGKDNLEGKFSSQDSLLASLNFPNPQYELVADYNDLENKPSINGVELMGNINMILSNTVDGWNSKLYYISEKDVIYIYTDKYKKENPDGTITNIPAIKIGDGTSYLIDMPFMESDLADELLNHINNRSIHVTLEEKNFWNKKERSVVLPDSETLLFINYI